MQKRDQEHSRMPPQKARFFRNKLIVSHKKRYPRRHKGRKEQKAERGLQDVRKSPALGEDGYADKPHEDIDRLRERRRSGSEKAARHRRRQSEQRKRHGTHGYLYKAENDRERHKERHERHLPRAAGTARLFPALFFAAPEPLAVDVAFLRARRLLTQIFHGDIVNYFERIVKIN